MVGRGIFICVEGLDGCGKTTQAKLLVNELKKHHDAVYTAEPSRGQMGKFIKKHYLHADSRGSAEAEALLFAADRVEKIRAVPSVERVRPLESERGLLRLLKKKGLVSNLEKVAVHTVAPVILDAKTPAAAALLPKRGVVQLDVVPETRQGRIENNQPRRSIRKRRRVIHEAPPPKGSAPTPLTVYGKPKCRCHV